MPPASSQPVPPEVGSSTRTAVELRIASRINPRAKDESSICEGEESVKLSARNQLKGRILEVRKGVTTAHVRISIGAGAVITAAITNEAVDELDLKPGDDATAVIKASDVIVAK